MKFAEDQKISEKTAKKLLDALYNKGLDATNLSRVIYRLEAWLTKTEIKNLMEKVTDDQVSNIIDEIVIEDQYYGNSRPVECFSFQEKSAWLFEELPSLFKDYVEGNTVKIQIMRAGEWNHPLYGKVTVDEDVIDEVYNNFKDNKRGINLVVDENHEPNHKALAIFKDLYKKGEDALYGVLELTKKGAELLSEGAYQYFSPEIVFQKIDEESGEEVTNLLIGGAFTNRPFFKAMQPLMASEEATYLQTGKKTPATQSYLLFSDNFMKKFLDLISKFSDLETITKAQRDQLSAAFNELSPEDQNDATKKAMSDITMKFSEDAGEADQAAADALKAKATGGEDTAKQDGQGEGDDTAKAQAEADAKKKEEDEAAAKAAAEATAKTEEENKASEIKANEDGTVSLKANEYEMLKANAALASKMIREKRVQMTEQAVKELSFSETNKAGVILPKSISKVAAFAASLSESQEKVFFELIGEFKSMGGAIGHGQESDTQTYSEEVKQVYTDKMGYTEEEAIELAKEDAKNLAAMKNA
jgi:predicted transcriptional regulator